MVSISWCACSCGIAYPWAWVGPVTFLYPVEYGKGDGIPLLWLYYIIKDSILLGCSFLRLFLLAWWSKWPWWRSPHGKELWTTPSCWGRPPAHSQQEAKALSPPQRNRSENNLSEFGNGNFSFESPGKNAAHLTYLECSLVRLSNRGLC